MLHAPFQGRFPFRSPAAVERAQRRRIARTLAHAFEYVPYYRETMKRLGLLPTDIRTASDLGRLPVIERWQLQANPEYFVSSARPIESYVKLRSGGSTGEPLTVFHDPFALFQGACHRERRRVIAMKLAGQRGRARQMTIESPLSSGRDTSSVFRVLSLVPATIRVVEEHLSLLDPPAHNVERINRFKPDVLSAYGSYLEDLFVHAHESGVDFHRPGVVLYSSDALSTAMRDLITREFGIPVLSAYGAIEAFHIGFECEQHLGFHLNSDIYPLRILDDAGSEVPDGASGHVTLSNLVNRGTILLNYRLGDVASKLTTHCPCGRTLPMLSFIEGRGDDWLDSPSGERVHPQAVRTLFTAEEEVLRYQVTQVSATEFDAAVVVAPGCDREALRARLASRFTDRLGEATKTDISFVRSLPRTEGGKVRTVIARRRDAFVIERAGQEDRDAILEVMRPANMHHVPSPEMAELELDRFFLARVDSQVVGAAGYTMIGPERGKTTLLAVLPEHGGKGIGAALQEARLAELHRLGAKTVVTNADRPATIAWYERRFGYKEVDKVEKLIPFGDSQIPRWTTLELDLEAYARRSISSIR